MRFLYPQIVDSGRAVIWPIYHGSNERYQGVWEMTNRERSVYYRDAVVTWRSELGRVIDYLEEREDIDTDKLAYLGTSYGSSTPAIAMTQEPRFKVAVFALGGYLELSRPPVAQPWNFLSRLRIPTLMINGRYDTIFPHEESQTPMYATLGAPADQKQHFIYDGGHGPDQEQEAQVLLWITDWLDRYLGRPDA
jgi:pimeloyl-ACP methyl ester carboxylesterase